MLRYAMLWNLYVVHRSEIPLCYVALCVWKFWEHTASIVNRGRRKVPYQIWIRRRMDFGVWNFKELIESTIPLQLNKRERKHRFRVSTRITEEKRKENFICIQNLVKTNSGYQEIRSLSRKCQMIEVWRNRKDS